MEQEKATKIKIREEIKRLDEMTVKWSSEKRQLKQTAQEKEGYLEDAKKSLAIAEERLLEQTRKGQKDKEIIKQLQDQLKIKDSMYTQANKATADFEVQKGKLEKKLEESHSLLRKLERDLAQLQEENRTCKDLAHRKEFEIKQFLENVFAAFPGTSFQPDFSTKELPAAKETLVAIIQSLRRKCEKIHQKCHLLKQEKKNGQKRNDEEIVCYRKSKN